MFYNAGITHLVTTAYAPSTNGLVERFNKTLKMMIMKFAEGHKENWDEKIDAFLFAYRTVPQSCLGFFPFLLMFGRECRTPITLLAEALDDTHGTPESVSEVEFVCRLQEQIVRDAEAAQDSLCNAHQKQQLYFNRKAVRREFFVGDKVLYLWPRRQS
jgi:hypothetical protein